MSENNKKIYSLLSSDRFLLLFCTTIFLLSIFIRSILGIGPDTGVYLDLGRKIANGKKYYYDFFEGNFPLSFYFYAFQFRVSNFLHINPIYMSEIVVNILGVASIYFSTKYLQKTTIYDNKNHYNLIIIGFCLAFFLRIGALEISEFGTKTSFLLALLFPYISSSFIRKKPFSEKELFWRGVCMGLIPCLKPHYLILILFIEFYNFWQRRSLKFFFEIDKLIMVLIGSFYLFLIIKFIPEFFESIAMQNSVYYGNNHSFLANFTEKFLWNFVVPYLILLVFSRIKFTKNDLILAIFLFEVSFLVAVENIGTIDQFSVFFAIVTICYLKWIYDLFCAEENNLSKYNFLIFIFACSSILFLGSLFLLSFSAFFYWVILPFFLFFSFSKNKKFSANLFNKILAITILYLVLFFISCLSLKYFKIKEFYLVSLAALFVIMFFIEKNSLNFSQNFSSHSIFLLIGSIFWFFGCYFSVISSAFLKDGISEKHNLFLRKTSYYAKSYAYQQDDKILFLTGSNFHQFPLLNYLEKENFYIASVPVNLVFYSENTNFLYSEDYNKSYTMNYLFRDLKRRIADENLKVLFVNKGEFCNIGFLEYYFKDKEFREVFNRNFYFKNHIKIFSDSNSKFFISKSNAIFNKDDKSKQNILYDFEVYIRREK